MRLFAGAPTPVGCLDAAAQAFNFASIVICAFSSFDTGHPVLALFAISCNFALSVPGILADTIGCCGKLEAGADRLFRLVPLPFSKGALNP